MGMGGGEGLAVQAGGACAPLGYCFPRPQKRDASASLCTSSGAPGDSVARFLIFQMQFSLVKMLADRIIGYNLESGREITNQMRNSLVFVLVLATTFMATAPVTRADTCSDNRHHCDDPASPECWFNPTRSEYSCSARGWTHCGALHKSYSCRPSSNCLGDGSAPPYCSSSSSSINFRRLPDVIPASFLYVPAKRIEFLPEPGTQR